jgi:hypothetical protein
MGVICSPKSLPVPELCDVVIQKAMLFIVTALGNSYTIFATFFTLCLFYCYCKNNMHNIGLHPRIILITEVWSLKLFITWAVTFTVMWMTFRRWLVQSVALWNVYKQCWALSSLLLGETPKNNHHIQKFKFNILLTLPSFCIGLFFSWGCFSYGHV